MASIIKRVSLHVPARTAWSALRDVGAAHRLFPGVLTDTTFDGQTRTVTFANGLVARERIITVDDDRRRLVYAVIDGRPSHHNASLEVLEEDGENCRVIWTTDFLPDALAPAIGSLVDQGAEALRRALENGGFAA